MPLKLSANECSFLVIGAGIAALFIYMGYSKADTPSPDVELAMAGGAVSDFLGSCAESEHFLDSHTTATQIISTTPHRYPVHVGGNITSLVHRGFTQLRLPSHQDAKWFTRPPAEVQW